MKKALISAAVFVAVVAGLAWEAGRPRSCEGPVCGPTAALAAGWANERAAQEFGVMPFSEAKGEVTAASDGWRWTDRRGFGLSDLQAVVAYDAGRQMPALLVQQTVISPWD